MRTPSWLSAHVVNVSVSHHESGGVAFNELRHDTTYNLHRDSENERIRILFEREKEQILSEVRT